MLTVEDKVQYLQLKKDGVYTEEEYVILFCYANLTHFPVHKVEQVLHRVIPLEEARTVNQIYQRNKRFEGRTIAILGREGFLYRLEDVLPVIGSILGKGVCLDLDVDYDEELELVSHSINHNFNFISDIIYEYLPDSGDRLLKEVLSEYWKSLEGYLSNKGDASWVLNTLKSRLPLRCRTFVEKS